MSSNKVLLVGPYPPPYGGLAVQLCELQRYLIQQAGYECLILNIGESRGAKIQDCISVFGYWDFVRKLFHFARRGYLIHLLTNGHNLKSWLSALICVAAGLMNGRKTVISFGSGNLPAYLQNVKGWVRLVVRVVLRSAGIIICRNKSMVGAIQAFEIEESRIAVVPGFMGLHGRSLGQVPQSVEKFCETHMPVFGATVTLSPEYGVPLALHALDQMRKCYPKLGLILIGIGLEAKEHLPELALVRDHVLLAGALTPDVTLSVMRRLSVFLRPTYFDGDSVSVREALALGVPVVASDTGFRPDGVILFEKGQLQDLVGKLQYTLNHLDELPSKFQKSGSSMSANLMVSIYQRLASQI